MSEEFNSPERLEFESELRKYAEARPFVPFDIVTASGEIYQVRETLQLAMGFNAVVLVLPRTGVQIIRKSQITAVHVHEPV